jgi:hypothetical protein
LTGKRQTFAESQFIAPIEQDGCQQGSARVFVRFARATAIKGMNAMPEQAVAKVRATLYLPCDILDEARNAVVFLAGPPARLTLTKLAEDALRAELERLKKQFNHGDDFPARDEELRGGRPIAA